jgi:hypothetical protein
MLNLLKEIPSFILELGASLWGYLVLALGFLLDILVTLHTVWPRTEGLIVGIGLALMMAHREKHPVLRTLSAPLKFVLDVLDLAWGQLTEAVKDIYSVVKAPFSWISNKGQWLYKSIAGGLRSLKVKLTKKKA